VKAWPPSLTCRRQLLDATLAEEKKTDESLSKLAETAVNYEAAA
jgi:ferritin-like metal-binding protein YciE